MCNFKTPQESKVEARVQKSKVLIVVGDATETVDTLYPYYRLIEGGYDGYLSSEYEGNRHIQDVFEVDSVEQVRRQQEMFKKLLGEKATVAKTNAVEA